MKARYDCQCKSQGCFYCGGVGWLEMTLKTKCCRADVILAGRVCFKNSSSSTSYGCDKCNIIIFEKRSK